jgi:hypothetical protein
MQVLAAQERPEWLVSLHQWKLPRVQRLRLDVCFGGTLGLGLLPLWPLVQDPSWLWLGLVSWESLGRRLGLVAPRAERNVLVRRLGSITARGRLRTRRGHQHRGRHDLQHRPGLLYFC